MVAPLRFLDLVVENIVIYVVKVVNALTLQLQQKTMPRKTGGPLVHAQVDQKIYPMKNTKRTRSLVVWMQDLTH